MENLTVKLKYLRIPPRKVRLLADTLKGLSASEAEARLMLSPHRPKDALLKLLRSGIANAKNNHQTPIEKLFIRSIRVDVGPRSKRWTPRAKGSAAVIQRLTSHVTLDLGIRSEVPSRFTVARTRPKKAEEAPKEKKPKTEAPKEKAPKKTETGESKPKAEPGSGRRIFRRKAI
ncbi:50S ribosomal protein L22 [Patescibacteria group bacterium]|nr:50S ribosomal protein L22 [Patescibacteria group bacterium]